MVNPVRSKAKQPAETLLGELAGRPLELAGNGEPREMAAAHIRWEQNSAYRLLKKIRGP